MGFFDRLFGSATKGNPTSDWPPYPGTFPEFDLAAKACGELKLGASLATARLLGRPAGYHQVDAQEILLYGDGQWELHFERDAFVYFAFVADAGPLDYTMQLPEADFLHLHRGIDREAVQNQLGEPRRSDTDDEETILFYEIAGLTVELELEPGGGLKRCNLFPSRV